jgi:hypothetical protein
VRARQRGVSVERFTHSAVTDWYTRTVKMVVEVLSYVVIGLVVEASDQQNLRLRKHIISQLESLISTS